MNINILEHPLFWTAVVWISYFITEGNRKSIFNLEKAQKALNPSADIFIPLGALLVSIIGSIMMIAGLVMMVVTSSRATTELEVALLGTSTLVLGIIVAIRRTVQRKRDDEL